MLRANLFLTPLDAPPAPPPAPALRAPARPATSAWYRYHPLLRDLLLYLLPERLGPGAAAALHARAGAWFAGAGMVEEGVPTSWPPGTPPPRRRWWSAHLRALLEEELPAVERWLGLLPSEVVERRPALLLARAWVAQRRGRNEALPALLAAAQAALDAPPAGRAGQEAPDGR